MGASSILHVVGGMDRGGVETWLMHVLRHIDRSRFRMDFLVHTSQPCAYDDEIRALGSRIIPCLHPRRWWTYARDFGRALQEHGRYDIVHSHGHHFSGYALRLAAQEGVPVRIAHSHNSRDGKGNSLHRRLYRRVAARWIGRHATHLLACSRAAAAGLYEPGWESDPRLRILLYGIETELFKQTVDKKAVREELGIPDGSLVLGHVGRFSPQKNHSFLIDLAAEGARMRPDAYMLLVGDGPLKRQIRAQACKKSIEDRVLFLGVRSDVPRLMLGAMDLFVFPSLWEGFGIALLEAQAAGLPCMASDSVPGEADVVPELIERLPLELGPNVWAKRILDRLEQGRISRPEALSAVVRSPFTAENSAEALEQLYDQCAESR